MNSDLVVMRDARPWEAVQRVVDACAASGSVVNLVYQKEITHEELKVEKEVRTVCKKHNVKVRRQPMF